MIVGEPLFPLHGQIDFDYDVSTTLTSDDEREREGGRETITRGTM
jgi:hypothetical protein